MASSDSQATMTVEETDTSKDETLDTSEVNKVGDGESAQPEKAAQDMNEDQYPHGLKLVLLAGASIIAVFLIALDQVSPLDNQRPLSMP